MQLNGNVAQQGPGNEPIETSPRQIRGEGIYDPPNSPIRGTEDAGNLANRKWFSVFHQTNPCVSEVTTLRFYGLIADGRF